LRHENAYEAKVINKTLSKETWKYKASLKFPSFFLIYFKNIQNSVMELEPEVIAEVVGEEEEEEKAEFLLNGPGEAGL